MFISIPFRYDWEYVFGIEIDIKSIGFQFLLGTIGRTRGGGVPPFFLLFQFLLGTIGSDKAGNSIQYIQSHFNSF